MRMSHLRLSSLTYPFFIGCLGLTVVLTGCGGKKSDSLNDEAKNRRAGREITSEGSAFGDSRPSISSSGARISFTSTRDGMPWIYTYDNGGTKKAEKIKSTTDLVTQVDSFTDSLLTPAGTYLLARGIKSGAIDLYLQDFAGTGAMRKLTDDIYAEGQLAVSSDSKLFAFSKLIVAADGKTVGQVYLVDITTPSSPTVSKVTADSTSEDTPFFINGSAPYVLATLVNQADNKGRTLVSRTFSTAAAAASVTVSSAKTNLSLAPGLGSALGTGSALLAQAYRFGEKNTSDNKVVKSAPLVLALNSGSISIVDIPGTEIMDGGAGVASDFTWWLTRNFFKDNDNRYGTSLILRNQATGIVSYLQPRTATEAGKWELGPDATSKKRADGTDGDLDYQIRNAKFSGGSTLTTYQVVYETAYSGDTEIRLLKVAAGKPEFVEISSCNKANNCGK